MKKISVIVPTFNERENIEPLLRAISGELRDLPYEVLVVDDQSPDGTAQAVKDLGDPKVRVIVRSSDPGFAKSIRCGIENAKGELLIIMDSDFNHDPACIHFMVQKLSEYDCVSGSRFLPGGLMTPVWRALASRIFNAFVRLATGSKMTDSLFGFFGLRREALERCPFDKIFFGFGDYGMRLLLYLQKSQVRICEFPAIYGKRPAGRGSAHRLFQTFFHYTIAVLRLAGKERIA